MTFINRHKASVNYNNVLTPAAPQTVTVGISAVQVVAQNNDRAGLTIVNLSTTNKIHLAFGVDAILNGGLTLLPEWGWKMDEYTFCVDSISAISDAVGTVVSIQEFNI